MDWDWESRDAAHVSAAAQVSEAERLRLNAQLITDVHEEACRDPIVGAEAKTRISVTFPEDLVEEARNLLKGEAPVP